MGLLEKKFHKINESASILKCRQQDLFDLARDKQLNLAVQARNRKVLVLQKQVNGDYIAIGECVVSGIFEAQFITALLHSHPLENRFSKSNYFQFQYLYPTSNNLLFDSRLSLKWSDKPNYSSHFLPFDMTFFSEGRYLLKDKQTNGSFAEDIEWVSVEEDEAIVL